MNVVPQHKPVRQFTLMQLRPQQVLIRYVQEVIYSYMPVAGQPIHGRVQTALQVRVLNH